MSLGMMAGAAAVDALEKRHDVTAANLANLSTPGYRRRVGSFSNFEHGMREITPHFTVKVDFSPGLLDPTDRPLDLALTAPRDPSGNAFFAVAGASGEERYTRNGSLALDSEGTLVQAGSGLPILGENGASLVLDPRGPAPLIDTAGQLSQGGIPLGRIKVVRFEQLEDLRPVERGLFASPAGQRAEPAAGMVEIRQGYVERSNANPMDELVGMVANYRAYEATQRVIRQIDRTEQNLVRQSV